jgi:hypothetical protein
MKLTVGPDVFTAELENSIKVLGLDTDGYFEIDGLAADIWRAIPEFNTRQALIDKFRDSVDEDLTDIEFNERMNNLIDQLIELQLILED